MFKGTWAKEEDGCLKITEFNNINPKGWFPLRLLNMIIGTMIGRAMKEMRRSLMAF